MRTMNPWKVSTIALTLALGLVAGGSFVSPASGHEKGREHEHERGRGHGHIRAALEQLRSAKKSLEQAAHEFGGHRAKALELTKKAIDEVEDGIKVAEQHPKGDGQVPKGGGQTPKGGGQTPKNPQGQQPK
jgi:hypothetical protein